MMSAPRIVAVDLTPVLPGGENGGAKVFVLELMRRLAGLAPQCQFVLLTRSESHDELEALDRSNMRRLMVLGGDERNSHMRQTAAIGRRLLPHLPPRLRAVAGRVGYRLNRIGRRTGAVGMLRQIGADLLFCPFTAPTYVTPGVPVVSTIYDLQYKTYPQFFSPEDVAHRENTFKAACREASFLAAISDYARESAIRHGELDPQRIRTIHLRLADRLAAASDADVSVLARLGLESGRYFIYPANFWKHKNHEMLLAAFGMAARRGLDQSLQLVCTGSPGERQDFLVHAAAAMGMGERVVFPGYVSTRELSGLLGNSLGMVFPSLYEGFGLPVVEAMAAGVAVACSNTTSLPEVAAGAAITFDPRIAEEMAAALIALANDSPLRQELVAAGRRRAEEFADGDRMATEYWELFCEAVATAQRSSSIHGVHDDGWLGNQLMIETARTEHTKQINFELFAPDWIPSGELKLSASCAAYLLRKRFRVPRGTTANWTLPAGSAARRITVDLGPAFVPADCGVGDDQRELTLMLRRCELLHEDGRRECLYPTDKES